MKQQKMDSRLEGWLASLETDMFGLEPTEDRRVKPIPRQSGSSELAGTSKQLAVRRNWRLLRTKPNKEDCLSVKVQFTKLAQK